jgi:hypothetical protein
MKFSFKLATVILPASLLVISCSKDDKKDSVNNDESAKLTTANVTAEAMFEDANNEIMLASQENALLSSGVRSEDGTITTFGTNGAAGTQGCVIVTVTPVGASFPKTVTVDYGDAGCTGTLGFTRKGKISYVITNRFAIPGASIVASFQNYSVNGYKIEGTYSISNTTTGMVPSVKTQVTDGKLTYPDGSFYTYSGIKNYVQTAGVQTPLNILDDELTITGSNSISSSDGRKLEAIIKTPLLKKITCHNIVSGTVEFTYNSVNGVWSYGTGDCDNTATIVVGTWSGTILLP